MIPKDHDYLLHHDEALTLKAPITTAADDICKYFPHCISEKIRLDVSSESSARQSIRMKNQALFSSKGKSKKLKCRLLQFLLRVKSRLMAASTAYTRPVHSKINKKKTCFRHYPFTFGLGFLADLLRPATTFSKK